MRAAISTIAAALLAVAGCGGQSDDPAEAGADTFAVKGHVTLIYGAEYVNGDNSGPCQGREGYSDLAEGANVTVADASGDKVALGQLQAGTVPRVTMSCRFAFEVTGVPAGSAVYSIEVTHRGSVDFARADAGSVELTVGSQP